MRFSLAISATSFVLVLVLVMKAMLVGRNEFNSAKEVWWSLAGGTVLLVLLLHGIWGLGYLWYWAIRG